MKNILSYISLFIILFTSCTELKEEPLGLLSPESFFQTPQDVEYGLNGAYAILTSEATYGRDLAYALIYASDYVEFGNQGNAERQSFQTYSIDPFNSINERIWRTFYGAISAANVAIRGAELIETDAGTKDALIAEGRFIRAFCYYNLVRLYGDLPLVDGFVTDPLDVKSLRRSPEAEIYSYIISDLEFAKDNLPLTQSRRSRASAGTASTLLADLYLTQGEYEFAAAEAKEIISNKDAYGYDLDSDYQALFDAGRQDASVEPIFTVDFVADFPLNSQGTSGLGFSYYSPNRTWMPNFTGVRGAAPPAPPGGGATRGFLSQYVMTIEAYNEWDPADYRTQVAVTDSLYDDGTSISSWELPGSTPFPITSSSVSFPVPHMEKYWKFPGWDWATERPTDERLSDQNFNLYRYADVLLIAAEALVRSGGDVSEATGYINALRARARSRDGSSMSAIPEDIIGAVTIEEVMAERKLELSFEFKRFYDIQRLVRNGHNSMDDFFGPGSSDPLEVVPNETRLYFPIPQSEIEAAGLRQNDGY